MIGWQGSDQSWPIVEVGLQYVANKSRSKYVKCFVNKIFHEAIERIMAWRLELRTFANYLNNTSVASNTSVLKLPNGCNVKNSNRLRASYFLPVEEDDWEGKLNENFPPYYAKGEHINLQR